jgi:hypothetical protein
MHDIGAVEPVQLNDVTPKIPSLKKMLATIRILFSKVNEFE